MNTGARKPVQLHVVHDLGGGIDRWYRDYCREDNQRTNLILKPVFLGDSFGAGLMLYGDAEDDQPIGFWPLSSAIDVTDTSHPEYRSILQEIVRDFSVAGVLVSSLIGHSLDALDTGLPTAVVTHDYFPACPAINAFFGEPCTRCDAARLGECHEANPRDYNPFAALSVTDRIALRSGFLDLVTRNNITLITPTDVTRQRWLQLFPELGQARIAVIPHGVGNLPSRVQGAGRHGVRLRIVVLGTLTAPKGFQLIKESLAQLAGQADVTFVGAGNLATFFEGQPHVRIIGHYTLGDLPGLIGEIDPDLGLLPSVCPETFSYALSELTALGVPVAATRVGAFIDRIEDGVTGFLFDPTPQALLQRVAEIDRDRHTLAKVAANIRTLRQRSVAEMVTDYHRELPLSPAQPLARPADSDDPVRRWARCAAPALARTSREQHQLRQRIEIQSLMLGERLHRIAHLNDSNETLHRQNDELATALAAHRRRIDDLTGQLNARSEALAAVEHRLQGILHSTSWAVTRPLRGLVMLARGQHGPLLAGLRHYLARWGRRAYWHLPVRWRQPTVGLAYRLGGSLFKGLPDYQRWLAQRGDTVRCAVGADMIDIDAIAPLSATPTGKIAIHAHVFYGDLADEFAGYLSHMPFDYDLFVSVPNESVRATCAEILARLPHQQGFTLQVVPNRGRDIAPLFCAFGPQLQQYSCIAHIHSKKSLYNEGRTTGWREYLLDGLLGSPDRIRRIFALLTGPEKIGMVYPQTYATVPYQAHTWLANRAEGEKWCHRLGIGSIPSGYFDMPAGSMFWARTDALRSLFEASIPLEAFPSETGQTDGTLAHTLERLLGVVPAASGWSVAVLRDQEQPSWSRWRVTPFFQRTEEGVLDYLGAPEVGLVVFDIFDTLLIRPLLDPEHTKQIVAARIGGKLAKFYLAERALVEHQARQRARRDVQLDDIYREWHGTHSLAAEELAELRSLEEAVEAASVASRPDAVQLMKRVAAAGKRIVLASDTYLPRQIVEAMLARHGITGWSHLYLSGEVGLRKDAGDLYRHLLERERVAPESVVMIGDNERSDFQIPADLGMRTSHLLRAVEIARSLPRWQALLEGAFAKNDLNWSMGLGIIVRHRFGGVFFPGLSPGNMLGSAREIGYAVVGPLTVAFAQWLAARSRNDGIEHLHFLAREGQFLHQVYERLRESTEEGPEGSYLVLSRRSVTVPMIESSSDIHALAEARFFPNDLTMFLRERYGLEIGAGDLAEFQRRGLWKERDPVEVRDGKIDHLLPLLEHLEPTILERAAAERPALLAYLQAVGLDSATRSAVVDVGYSATIQARLNRLIGRPVAGYYLVTTDAAGKVSATQMVTALGCFGNAIPSGNRELGLYRQSFELEKLLSSDEHQVLHYRLAPDDNGTTSAIACYRDAGIDDEGTRTLRAEIQAGALAFVDDVLALKRDLLPSFVFPPELASNLFDALMSNTSADELDILRGIVLDDYYCGRGLVS